MVYHAALMRACIHGFSQKYEIHVHDTIIKLL